ncbi:hypothetical protein KSP39_PZI014484 [Platanthera zijinensis]|uniref:DUF4216 domain-containing protein n=1 Tax=Platanthera zijinensis TaxID=2320716 RepID=A0AAP0BAE3_9ASPA
MLYFFCREHELYLQKCKKRSTWSKGKNQRDDFIQWFETRAMNDDVHDWVKELSRGPNNVAKMYSAYIINGYRFHTRKCDARRKTQNSGVTLEAVTPSFKSISDENPATICMTYYGAITSIIELDYYGHLNYVLFKCVWFEAEEDNYGMTCVYFNKECYKNDPFVLASQVQQCFYVEDSFNKNKHYVLKVHPRDSFEMGDNSNSNTQEVPEISINIAIQEDDCEVDLAREDVPDDIIELPLSEIHVQHTRVDDEAIFESENEIDAASIFSDNTN